VRKTIGLADILRTALHPLDERLAMAFVYGSMAKDRAHARSDVDVMLVGTCGFAEAVLVLQPAQDALHRDINPTVMTLEQFERELAEPGSFVAAVWKEPKLWLKGDKDGPGKPDPHAPAATT
jgi:predicted nucleotidyltransferase